MYKKIILVWAFLFWQTSVFSAEITVAAASSLTDAFKVIAQDFEKKYPKTKVNLTFASSGTLLQQLRHGAPIDVLATADQQTMNEAHTFGLIQTKTRINFTSNQLVLIAPKNSKIQINDLRILKQEQVKHIAIGNPAYTPAGRYAQAVLKQQNLWATIQKKLIKTQNVRHALDYVARGEAQVGFVFSSDVLNQINKVKIVMNIPTLQPIQYPIAATTKTQHIPESNYFIQYVKSEAGQNVLQHYGFRF
ncbi:molybdate ABC transporter substrate-binding protein [Acinetobacter sp. ANC 4558]|uniref:molybdate ABC transporter substrate-binding protein n=1 Tax=Acinetobacter sp. ANC 4558 TaxID=1977876 RepID=UPI000A344198|nr:molybdate ABC transporter substrate-binding protein [Acinetobacter sp. ANC 4558]OTG87065.1 molybdate ABC transporter substrate-binding protein [Acinetobacter sp. ANC 4558]